MAQIPADQDAQSKRGWGLELNGTIVDEVTYARLTQSRMGVEVTYGDRPEGFDGVVIREPGGAATMPFMIDDYGRIFVGVVEESRPTMGEETTLNIPRGFTDFTDRNKQETALRELREETGLRALGSRMILLTRGLNPNSTYFDYSASPEAGIDLYAVPVRADELEIEHGGVYYTFPAHIRAQAEGDGSAERITGSRFISITEALRSRDMFTSAAAGQLMARLLSEGEYLLPQTPLPARDALPASSHPN